MLKKHPLFVSGIVFCLLSLLAACQGFNRFLIQDLNFPLEIEADEYLAPHLDKLERASSSGQEKSCGGYEITAVHKEGSTTCGTGLEVGDSFSYVPKDQLVSDFPFACSGCPSGANNVEVKIQGAVRCRIDIKLAEPEAVCAAGAAYRQVNDWSLN